MHSLGIHKRDQRPNENPRKKKKRKSSIGMIFISHKWSHFRLTWTGVIGLPIKMLGISIINIYNACIMPRGYSWGGPIIKYPLQEICYIPRKRGKYSFAFQARLIWLSNFLTLLLPIARFHHYFLLSLWCAFRSPPLVGVRSIL